MNRNVEILAPAGSFMSMQASFKAGADAVYMGGRRFGARAYAENPEDDELRKAIDYAHMRGKRLYLTVNTIVKENELGELYDYLKPLYLHGLDAVIVQDLGALKLISRCFPELPVHISTQMSLTTAEAGKLFGSNVVRIVPARELTIEEIAELKKNSGLELEVFVHGALCYSYSGQCLFSSACGDRSGNRGRCAQPCRKPYYCGLSSGHTQPEKFVPSEKSVSFGKDGLYAGSGLPENGRAYLLSPKDICTLDRIPDLIEAGVDSFKIEGRMKSPAYACGVTEIYRKAVDLYYELGREGYYRYIGSHASEWQDFKTRLADLFNRGGFSEGYAFSETGSNMMSVDRPNHEGVFVGEAVIEKGFAVLKPVVKLYQGDVLEIRDGRRKDWYSYTTPVENGISNTLRFKAAAGEMKTLEGARVRVFRLRCERLLRELNERYVEAKDCIPVTGSVYLAPGSEMVCSVETALPNGITGRKYYAAAAGETISEAVNAPLTEKTVSDKVMRSGDSEFEFTELSVEIEGRPFAAKSVLGSIRRQAFALLRQEICNDFRRTEDGIALYTAALYGGKTENAEASAELSGKTKETYHAEYRNEKVIREQPREADGKVMTSCITTSVEQLEACISSDYVDRVVIDTETPVCEFFLENAEHLTGRIREKGKQLFFRTAQIADEKNLGELKGLAETYGRDITGFYIRNLSAAQVIQEVYAGHPGAAQAIQGLYAERLVPYLIADKNLYAANSEACGWFAGHGFSGFVYPSELDRKEMAELDSGLDAAGVRVQKELCVYGREQLMLSRQCIKNSLERCNGKREWLKIVSEEGKEYPVFTDCKSCRNRIYNADVTDLWEKTDGIKNPGIDIYRFEFTDETESQTKEVLFRFSQTSRGKTGRPAAAETRKNRKNEKNLKFGHFERPVL